MMIEDWRESFDWKIKIKRKKFHRAKIVNKNSHVQLDCNLSTT